MKRNSSSPSVFAQFHPKNAMSLLLFYNIDYSESCRPFQSKKLQLIKIKDRYLILRSLYIDFNRIIHRSFRLLLIFINYEYRLLIYYFKFTPWWYFKILIPLKEQKRQKLAFTQYSVKSTKSLILASAYAEFFLRIKSYTN